MDLHELGFSAHFQQYIEPFTSKGLTAARVVRADRSLSLIVDDAGTRRAELTGRFLREATERAALPVVGDWVAVSRASGASPDMIHAVLPRHSAFSRRASSAKSSKLVEEQVLCANVDVVFIVAALDGGRTTNPQQLERYLALAHESGADPILVFNKADLCDDVEAALDAAARVAPQTPAYPASARSGVGVEELARHVRPGRTAALLGPSGVGKSSLINALVGEARQAIGEVRAADNRGRHTTTCGELIFLPSGGMLIDTPGLRTLRLWLDEDGSNRRTAILTSSPVSASSAIARTCMNRAAPFVPP
jgi:ribosome biogenesis GTPase